MFESNGLTTKLIPYQVVSVVAHLGTDRAGHCRAMLCTGNGHDTDFRKLITDDNVLPDRQWNEPFWLRTHAVWLCMSELVEEPVLRPIQVPDDPMQANVECRVFAGHWTCPIESLIRRLLCITFIIIFILPSIPLECQVSQAPKMAKKKKVARAMGTAPK